MVKILRFPLRLEKTVIEGAGFDGNSIVVAVRPYKSEMQRCPECGRRRPVYDRSASPRSWRPPTEATKASAASASTPFSLHSAST